MSSRFLGPLLIGTALVFGGIRMANAGTDNGKGNGGQNNGRGNGQAPELDPTIFGSGIAMLIGGILILNERRDQRK
jgi:hypothetical protein